MSTATASRIGLILAYREGNGCRQYVFKTSQEFLLWAARHPYRSENLFVTVCHPKGEQGGYQRLLEIPARLGGAAPRYVAAEVAMRLVEALDK